MFVLLLQLLIQPAFAVDEPLPLEDQLEILPPGSIQLLVDTIDAPDNAAEPSPVVAPTESPTESPIQTASPAPIQAKTQALGFSEGRIAGKEWNQEFAGQTYVRKAGLASAVGLAGGLSGVGGLFAVVGSLTLAIQHDTAPTGPEAYKTGFANGYKAYARQKRTQAVLKGTAVGWALLLVLSSMCSSTGGC
jgi:hypothetical protein